MQFSMNNLCRYLLLPVITSNHIRSGDKGIRTLDPLLARQVLSQLSYTPIKLLLSKNQNVLQVLSFFLMYVTSV